MNSGKLNIFKKKKGFLYIDLLLIKLHVYK